MPDHRVTVPRVLDCSPPYSFFFDLMGALWRHPSAQYASLHRVCVIARSLGVNRIVLEDAADRQHVQAELQELCASASQVKQPHAYAISFFVDPANRALGDSSEPDAFIEYAHASLSPGRRTKPVRFVGQVILINCAAAGTGEGRTYIYEAVMHPPRSMSADDSMLLLQQYEVQVRSRSFVVDAAYYCQQNAITSNCGHAAIRTLMTGPGRTITTSEIDAGSGQQPNNFTPTMKSAALITAVNTLGKDRKEKIVPLLPGLSRTALPPSRETVLTSLVAAIESGFSAVVTHSTGHMVTTQGGADHVVTAVGYAIDRNLWHPQAVRDYEKAGTDKSALESARWVRHLIVHDENFGPYRTLGIRSFPPLEDQPTSRPADLPDHLTVAAYPKLMPKIALGLFDFPIIRSPLWALDRARDILMAVGEADYGGETDSGDGPDRDCPRDWGAVFFRHPKEQVLRPVAIRRGKYLSHLTDLIAKVKKTRRQPNIRTPSTLPDRIDRKIPAAVNRFWMVELSHTLLFTGLDAKIGELLIVDCPLGLSDQRQRQQAFWWLLRLPGKVVGVVDGQWVEFTSPVRDYGPMYRSGRLSELSDGKGPKPWDPTRRPRRKGTIAARA